MKVIKDTYTARLHEGLDGIPYGGDALETIAFNHTIEYANSKYKLYKEKYYNIILKFNKLTVISRYDEEWSSSFKTFAYEFDIEIQIFDSAEEEK